MNGTMDALFLLTTFCLDGRPRRQVLGICVELSAGDAVEIKIENRERFIRAG
jgi:hypothetical protein